MGFGSPDTAILPRHPLIIGDRRLEQGSGGRHRHIYPANGRETCELTLGSADDVHSAVRSARSAFPAWRALAGDKRRDLLLKMASLIEQHSAEFAQLCTLENGSVSMMTPHIVVDAIQKFRYFAGWADKIQGETINTWGGPAHNYVSYEPYGVVGAIVPWNGPLFAATMVVTPALATGTAE